MLLHIKMLEKEWELRPSTVRRKLSKKEFEEHGTDACCVHFLDGLAASLNLARCDHVCHCGESASGLVGAGTHLKLRR